MTPPVPSEGRTVDPRSYVTLQTIRARHERIAVDGLGLCARDEEIWPCDSFRLLAALREAEKREQRLNGLLMESERAKSEMLAGDAGRLVEELALSSNVVEAARAFSQATVGGQGHQVTGIADDPCWTCALHNAVAALDAHRDAAPQEGTRR